MARRVRILVCRGPECGDKRNSTAVHAALKSALAVSAPAGLEVLLDWQSCFGKCQRGVNVMVQELRPGEDPFFRSFLTAGPGSALYSLVKPSEAERIVREHVCGGSVVVEWKGRGKTLPPSSGEG
jgi:(2Fe-2S) ferredoxin